MQSQRQFLPRHFSRNHAQWQISDLVFRIEPWAFGQLLPQPGPQIRHTMSPLRRNHKGFLKRKGRVQLLRQG